MKNKNGWWKSLLSGSIPAIFLGIAAFWGLSTTSMQIEIGEGQVEILKEQLSYIRSPLIRIYLDPPRQGSDDKSGWKLYLSNLGNETAVNVDIRLGFYIVSDTSIYTYKQEEGKTGFTDTLRNAKERIWPRLTLAPDEEIDFIEERFQHLLFPTMVNIDPQTYLDNIDRELFDLKRKLKGTYVLMIEYSFRRKSDLAFYADTAFYEYILPGRIWDNLTNQVGGPGLIDRLKQYKYYGPNRGIVIDKDGYRINTMSIDLNNIQMEYLRK